MKNRFYLIGVVVLLAGYMAMLANPVRADMIDAPILTTIQGIQSAFSAWEKEQNLINQKINGLNKELASHMVDQNNVQGQGRDNILATAPLITQAEKQQEVAQDANKEATDKSNAAMSEAIEKNKPNPADCQNYTTQILSIYNQNQSAKYAQQLVNADVGYIKSGSPPTTVNAKISDSVNQAITSVDSNGKMSNNSLIPYQPDENVVLNSCTNNTCYNNWVIQQETNLYQQTAGALYPGKATSNPQIVTYRTQYAAWLSERSKNRKIISEADTRMMFKYPDFYTQALNAYQANTSQSASAAATYITGIYPHADTVGLTAKEMDEVVYLSFLKKSQDSGDSTVDQKVLAQAKANYEADEDLYRQHEQAMEKIVSPPQPPVNGIAVSGGGGTANK